MKNYKVKSLKNYLTLFIGAMAVMFFNACKTDPNSPGVEYMPDMYHTIAAKPYTPNPNFKDGMSARTPVKGTIPRGYMPYPYPNTAEGYEAAGANLKNPLEPSEANIKKGKDLYLKFCSHCHGETGDNDGGVIATGKFAKPFWSSYKSDYIKTLPEGKMYHTIYYGKNMMGSHASQINAKERWQIILYVQQLSKGIY